jgi:hypothetical protein
MTPEEAVLKHLTLPEGYGAITCWDEFLSSCLHVGGCDWLADLNECHNPIPGEAVKALCLRHEAVIQQLREAEAKAAACVLAMKPLLGDVEYRAHDHEAPADMREDALAYVSACDADALPARAKSLLAVVEAAVWWARAKQPGSAFQYRSAVDALSAAVDAWRATERGAGK